MVKVSSQSRGRVLRFLRSMSDRSTGTSVASLATHRNHLFVREADLTRLFGLAFM